MAGVALGLSVLSTLGMGYFVWSFRRHHRYRTERVSNQVSGLLAEFKSISASSVSRVEDRLRNLNHTLDEADDCAGRLEELVEHADLLERCLRPRGGGAGSSLAERGSRRAVLRLARDGLDPEEIAERAELSPRQVRLLLRISRSEGGSP